MAATDFQSLLSSPNVSCYRSAGSERLLKLALLQIIANALAPNVATDYQSLLSAANVACYNQNDYRLLELALLQIIASNALGGGSGVVFGNYGGNAPNFTPASGNALAFDTSNGRVWWYYGGQWQ